jgi:peptide/nickel transport system permease protein
MSRSILRRVVLLVPTLLGITFVVFAAVRFLPGDAIDQISSQSGAPNPELRRQLEEKYSLNQNIPTQYLGWMADIVRGDLGTSIGSSRAVTRELRDRLPVTFQLGVMALSVSLLISLPVGVLSAVKQDTPWDYISRTFAIGFLAVPTFWLGLIVITYGFQWFGWTPPLRYHRLWDQPVENLKTMWVPALILGASLAGGVTRLTRSMMLEVLRQDYIRTATAKGLGGRTVVVRHAVRNAIIPVVSVIGLQVPVIVGGTVILERIFSLPGMGNLMLDAISTRDYPIVQAVVLISATTVVLSNFVTDIAYSIIDPRIRSV